MSPPILKRDVENLNIFLIRTTIPKATGGIQRMSMDDKLIWNGRTVTLAVYPKIITKASSFDRRVRTSFICTGSSIPGDT